jgi:phosphoribosyl 1,2-cyclic phosphate phosphodiesterase
MLETSDQVILIDTPTDLRQQALANDIRRVDAVLYTHCHADHVLGLDELRTFNQIQRASIPCFGSATALAEIESMFHYVFEPGGVGGGKPRLDLEVVSGRFLASGVEVTAIPVFHGDLEIFGYRVGDFAYLTDCSRIPEESFELLRGLELVVLDALRYRPHATHFSVSEALEAAERIGARRTLLTHMTHEIDYTQPAVVLPPQVEFAYDGLVIELS